MIARSMTAYAIGDVQGCHQQVLNLIDKIRAVTPDARYVFVGDLVNRGPRSLEMLRYLRSMGERVKVVLGNHDLHLLAMAHGIRKPHKSDTLDAILEAPDRKELLDWLRYQPLALMESGHLIVHAGVVPQWSVEQTLALAQEVADQLRSPNWLDFMQHMYGNTPERWDEALQGADRLRCIINTLTRIRYCRADGTMEFTSTESSEDSVEGYMRWFDVPDRKTAGRPVVFGHWSTLGLTLREDLIGLDTGCVWGGKLTAVNLTDHGIVQVSCPQQQKPGKKNH
jgi:bis(5'-nucleosyl)-tetraphosphatase (symmetrical)